MRTDILSYRSDSLFDTESVNTHMGILLSRIKKCRREMSMVRCIRIFLRLESNGLSVIEGSAIFAACRSIKEITSIELKGRLVCQHFHETS